MKYLLLALTLILSITFGFAQNESAPEQDMVIMMNHSKLEGTILEVSKRWVVIKVGSVPFSIAKNRIRSISYNGKVVSMMSLERKNKEEKVESSAGFYLEPMLVTEKFGVYNITSGAIFFQDKMRFFGFETSGFIGGNGFGVDNVTGYQFNQYTGLGLGIGYQSVSFDDELKVVPIYAEYRGYLRTTKISPYYSLGIGAVFATKNEDSDFVSSKAGSYFYPAFGFKSGSDEGAITVDLGLRIAGINLSYETNRSGLIEERESLNSVVLRIGIML